MKEIEFNLVDEPWIRVLLPDGKVQEVGIKDVLLNAPEYVDLAGELPTQDVAVLRMLLAILHTVLSPVDEDGHHASFSSSDDALICWSEVWNQGSFTKKPLEEYLDKWKDRFWLFHPKRPFWQTPQAAIGTRYGSSKLNGEISESSNKLRLFTSYSKAGKNTLSYSQAARWLLYINGYDDTSAKPKTKGRPSVGVGWLGKLGLILAQGNNLFETLMLNLTLLKDGKETWGPAKPCWELDVPESVERREISWPDNVAQLLTLQSRRLLLYRSASDSVVAGYSLLGGDFFSRDNFFSEQMTVWKAVGKKNEPRVFRPKRHNHSIQFWREFPSVFTEEANVHQPGIVQWIATLMDTECLDSHALIHFRIVAVEYGDKDFFVTNTFSDALSFHAKLLENMGLSLRKIVTEEISHCESLATQVGVLAKDLAVASGGDGRALSRQAQSQFYFNIDQPFRNWLSSINPGWEEEKKNKSQAEWQKTAQKIARALGDQMILKAGVAAFVGRNLTNIEKGKAKNEIKRHISSPEAYNRFIYMIRNIYQS